MDNQNNLNVNNNQNSVNTSNQQTTSMPQSNLVNVNEVTPNQNTNTANNNNNSNNNDGGGAFKTLFAFVFLIGMIVMVLFLPKISEYFESKQSDSGNNNGNNGEKNTISKGTLLCNKIKTDKNDDYTYEIKIVFDNKKIETAKYTTKIESYDNPAMIERKTKCDNASNIAASLTGVTKECRLNDTVYVTIENYKFKELNTNELTSYVEAGGTNPEYKYGQDVYEVQKDLIKKEYDCEVLSTIPEEE